MGIQIITDDEYGCYIWEVNGHPVGDADGNYMLIQSRRGDKSKIAELEAAAKYYGVFDDGKAVFTEGRPVSDEEYQLQLARAEAGLVPDPFEKEWNVKPRR